MLIFSKNFTKLLLQKVIRKDFLDRNQYINNKILIGIYTFQTGQYDSGKLEIHS